ncbi:50S ribosomal protein L15 [Candidatus Roizmanbacteria bacterium RIFCSPHIGHO2_01_FULL_39_8]|uniref:Large ribosomal subunit protein uL15 n=3 Tax=Candidatus Roizmaniibacteriota TaxID=1752723 RepID=A0A1F7GNQ2_9BACT|nr:MAG: 50S ribosomal protein L15 [Candidatus Roizmanbacteria bacterium RIFCSPHIGHO2_01_FULL_39_8]OGK27480.1 MAG: 50S ribosomal protein L15 [Candidatus Roizmanbacteria bacterium RIFCSPHIGHO2_02_FULL_39_9]OGK34915.1 MAG: 50S ribosomal protein L15 [Candidatus Roizmanbacteria bacterium RIFCSPHIGHO2_12_FULL_39_8]
MQNILSNLPQLVQKKKKRLGRGLGSGRGSKSGRGTTRHQKARESIPLHFEGGQSRMVKKFPLLRGKGRNKSKKVKPFVVHVHKLNIFKQGDEITMDKLISAGLIDSPVQKTGVKILAGGKLEKKLVVKLPTSKAAKLAIEKAGGKNEL